MPKKKTVNKLFKGWNLLQHGVTQSLLAKFASDEERTHIRYARLLKPVNRKEAMDFGTIFHKLDELGSKLGAKYNHAKVTQYMAKWVQATYGGENVLLGKIALLTYKLYRDWEDKDKNTQQVDQEVAFNEPFHLPPLNFKADDGNISIRIPSGLVIPLRGRIDGVLTIDGKLWLKENKTKSRIDMNVISNTIHRNIQVMLYAKCAELKYGIPCAGVVYNIIRKPNQSQRSGRKTKNGVVGAESELQFLKRIEADILKNQTHYFTRLKYEFPPNAVENWTDRTLLPYLYKIYMWWRSWEKNPLNPWVDAHGERNPFHAERPFGIFDPLSIGIGDYFNYLVNGSTVGLKLDENLFPELEDEDESDVKQFFNLK